VTESLGGRQIGRFSDSHVEKLADWKIEKMARLVDLNTDRIKRLSK